MESPLNATSPFFLLLFLLLTLLQVPTPCISDPNPLQDFCIPPSPAGKSPGCKDVSAVVSDDFFFDGLAKEGNTNNSFGVGLTQASVVEFPGLNTLGMAIVRIDLAPGGLNPPHSHPRGSELVMVVEGTVLVGFVSTDNVLYQKVAKRGELVIVPKGLVHFQKNMGKGKAVAVAVFDSQFPGVVSSPLSLFRTEPAMDSQLLAKAFRVDGEVISGLLSNFGN
ncbi:germin-like protein 3-7 [Elaeis guineensis]|uniref:Germin-like protein n=1 Tax=Elaeis guineensis var. tenera TaxID=51953 RepID=A0A6I9S813_ELAGV|nr:germin-like protein 3-7 [Elaeis guineensis]